MAYWHFTHVDDVGVILQYLQQGQGTDEIEQGAKLAQSWTYAPLQGIFTSLLVNRAFPYRLNVFLGRLPSCLFGVFTVFLSLRLARFIFDEQKKIKYLFAFVCSLVAFSWENIIYSAQTEPYEIVVFFGLLIFLSYFQKFYESWKMSFIYLLVFTAGCYGHYQFFILIFCYYAALFIFNIKNKTNLIKIIAVSFGNLFSTIPLLRFFLKTGRLFYGVNGNKGLGDQFFLTFADTHIINHLKHFLKFFAKNTLCIYKYFFTVDSFDILSTVFACVLLVLSIAGFFFMHKKNKLLALFSDLLIIITVAFVAKQKLVFGPSRHCLYLYPMLLLFVCYGLNFFYELLSKANLKPAVLGSFVIGALVFHAFSFVFSLPREIGNRKNLLNEDELNKVLVFFAPEYIYQTDWCCDLRMMNFENYSLHNRGSGGAYYLWDIFKKNVVCKDKGNILIVCKRADFDNVVNNSVFYENFRQRNMLQKDDKKYDLLYKKEIDLGTEIEYAQKYWNWGNGLHIYVLDCESNL